MSMLMSFPGNERPLSLTRRTAAARLLTVTVFGISIPLHAAIVPSGWVLDIGGAGGGAVATANIAPTEGTQFEFIDTRGSTDMSFTGVADATQGTALRSSPFTLSNGEVLSLDVNFLTNDGGTFQDFAFVQLLNAGTVVATLFTANTTDAAGTAVPPNGGPGNISSGVTLAPSSASFDDNATGPVGGVLYGPGKFGGGPGGATGWITSSYTPGAGTYQLLFGVSDVRDTNVESGLAIDNIRTRQRPIEGFENVDVVTSVPEPQTYICLSLGLAIVAAARFVRDANTEKPRST